MSDTGGPGAAVKKIPKKWVWVGVAGAGGFVLWRYYQASRAAQAAPAPDGTMDTGSVTDAAPGVGGGGNVQYAGSTQAGDASITTNSAWTQAATDYLTNTAGYGAQAVVEALGNYLAGNPLTDAQITIVRAALAVQGQPPQGGPYTIKHTTNPTTPAPSSQRPAMIDPSSLVITSHSAAAGVRVQFNPVPGATQYQGSFNGGQHWFLSLGPAIGATAPAPGAPRFKAKQRVTLQLRAVNAAGVGPITSRTIDII